MINCKDIRCKYCNKDYKCINEDIELSYYGVSTELFGFQDFLKCEKFEKIKNEEIYKKLLKNS